MMLFVISSHSFIHDSDVSQSCCFLILFCQFLSYDGILVFEFFFKNKKWIGCG
ncbi:uncharacterized protein DS421_7g212380 [Arachis hypogaea]|nr:uncharacterized protein DS421_7g212380 [Arachis hypogaea]